MNEETKATKTPYFHIDDMMRLYWRYAKYYINLVDENINAYKKKTSERQATKTVEKAFERFKMVFTVITTKTTTKMILYKILKYYDFGCRNFK